MKRTSFRNAVTVAMPMALMAAVLVVVPGASPAAAPVAPNMPQTCVSAHSDEAAASRTAKACGTPVEVLSARSETGHALANPDGTTTLVTSAEPERVRRADGS